MTGATTARDAGAKVLILEKAPEHEKGGNSRRANFTEGEVTYGLLAVPALFAW